MIEIECFQRGTNSELNCLNIWVNGGLIHTTELTSSEQLKQLRDDLHNELLWINDYLREKGLE
jgi:hypothetical protein